MESIEIPESMLQTPSIVQFYAILYQLVVETMEFVMEDFVFSTLVVLLMLVLELHSASAAIGVNYGMLGDNLPSPQQVISLYKKEHIPLLRLLEPKVEALQALKGSNITVELGVKNEDVKAIADSHKSALDWVKGNIVPYAKDVNFGWITLGRQMIPRPDAKHVLKAMKNIQRALHKQRLKGPIIKVSTVVHIDVLGVPFPPSIGDFSNETRDLMKEIVSWLAATGNPLLINVYPYFLYSLKPVNFLLEYALFNARQPKMDGEYGYFNMFEAVVDAFYSAMEKNGGQNVTIVVAETGWPTAGNEPHTSVENARAYNKGLIDKMKHKGTPRKPNAILDIFIFAMFNENKKPSGVEQNWGIHYPNMSTVYPLSF